MLEKINARRAFIFSAAFAMMMSVASIAQAAEESEPILLTRTERVQHLVDKGMSLIGIPYVYGGENVETGLDCSGLVKHAFKESLGFNLPRTAKELSMIGEKIKERGMSSLKPGDLVFFNTMKRAFSHVGVYVGGGKFLHAPRTGADVRVETIDQKYWVKRFNGARRLVSGQDSDVALVKTVSAREDFVPRMTLPE